MTHEPHVRPHISAEDIAVFRGVVAAAQPTSIIMMSREQAMALLQIADPRCDIVTYGDMQECLTCGAKRDTGDFDDCPRTKPRRFTFRERLSILIKGTAP